MNDDLERKASLGIIFIIRLCFIFPFALIYKSHNFVCGFFLFMGAVQFGFHVHLGVLQNSVNPFGGFCFAIIM